MDLLINGVLSSSLMRYNTTMNYQTAIEVLESVASRLRGKSGGECSFSREEVMTAFQIATTAITHVHNSESRRKALPDRAGERWTAAEDAKIKEAFLADEAVSVIAERHGRTRGAIQSRLVKLGLITLDGEKEHCIDTAHRETPKIIPETEPSKPKETGTFRPSATVAEITGRVGGKIPQEFHATVESDRFGSREDVKKLRSENRSDLFRRINGRS